MPFRVATLNIWNRMGPWDERLAAIRAALPGVDADVLGLQEVLKVEVNRETAAEAFDQAALIAEGFGYHVAYGRNEQSAYPLGNAILSRWPIARAQTFPLPCAGTDEHRSLVFAELDAPFGRLPVFCTHLNWKLHEGHVREQQVRFVADRIHELAPTGGLPAVLVGDFNAEPGSDEIRFLSGLTSLGGRSVYFADAFGLAAGGAPGFTYARTNPFAAPLREPSRRIDYVFVRGPDAEGRGEPLDARVCFDAPHGADEHAVFPSDHYGVVATLSTE
jgi:endonuclease/exonuclease/phosphatase family metal-dependent hydrolase